MLKRDKPFVDVEDCIIFCFKWVHLDSFRHEDGIFIPWPKAPSTPLATFSNGSWVRTLQIWHYFEIVLDIM